MLFRSFRQKSMTTFRPAFALPLVVAGLLPLLGKTAVAQEVFDCGPTTFHIQNIGSKILLSVPGFSSFELETETSCKLQDKCSFVVGIGDTEQSWGRAFETEINGLCASTKTNSETYENSHFRERGDYRFVFKEATVKRITISIPSGKINLIEVRYHTLPDDYGWALFHGDDVNGATLNQDIILRNISITD